VIAIFLLAVADSPVALQPSLQPWAGLIGHCWVGNAPDGKGRDEHCFEAVYGGQHVRDRHVVTIGGKSVYSGETLYSVQGRRVIFTYWNSLGGVGTGEMAAKGDEWRFTGTIHATPNAPATPMSAVWHKTAAGYEVLDAPDAQPRPFELTGRPL
jgi:hypothetical protein